MGSHSHKKICVATFESWSVIVEDDYPRACFLWNSNSHEKIMLPKLLHRKLDFFFKCILTSPPTHQRCLILFAHKKASLLLYCTVGDKRWKTSKYDNLSLPVILSPFFSCLVCCNRYLYALDGEQANIFIVNLIAKPPRYYYFDPFVPTDTCMKKHQLVESHGGLYVIQRKFLLSLDVFRMDIRENTWVKISNLGDLVFAIVHNYTTSFSAMEFGTKGNCIYFTEDGDKETLYMFSLDDKSLSILKNRPDSSVIWFSHNGFMPKLRLTNSKEQVISQEVEKKRVIVKEIKEEENEDMKMDESILSLLPLDLQILIAKHILNGWDYMNFRATCRRFKSLLPPIRWKSNLTCTPLKYPWFMFMSYEGLNGKYKAYDPKCNVTHCITITELIGCKILFSSHCWLLVSKGARSMFFLQPFSKKKIQLPNLLEDRCFDGISFSASPTSSAWQIFGFCHECPRNIRIAYLRSNDISWTHETINFTEPFFPSFNNPVFWRQSFYCLGRDGSLGVFKLKDEDYSWHIHHNSLSLSRILSTTTSRSFLVSSGNELISIFIGEIGKVVHVYKLDILKMIWLQLKNFRNGILYLSQISSIVVQSMDKIMQNTIQFPMFSGVNNNNNNIFYSLENRIYQTLDGKYASEDLYDSKEMLSGIWIQPLLTLDGGL